MSAYRVTIDKEACEGIFACLTRDPRFVEDEDGLATLDPDADPVYDGDGTVWHTEDDSVVAEFDDDRGDEARQAADACPPGAITVQPIPDEGDDGGGVEAASKGGGTTTDGGGSKTDGGGTTSDGGGTAPDGGGTATDGGGPDP